MAAPCPYASPQRARNCRHALCRFNQEAFQWLLAQTAAEAMAKLGIRPASNAYSLSAF
jgi:hypothetical protein